MAKDPFAGFRIEKKPTDEAFAKLDELIRQLLKAEKDVEVADAALKKAQAVKRQLEEYDLPEFMAGLGLSDFTSTSGLCVTVIKKIRASIGDRKAKAFKWLIENGHGGLIKRSVMVAFNVDQGDAAGKLVKELRLREDCGAGVKQEMKVEAASLTSFVRKQLEAGTSIPTDVFGVFEQKYAKIDLKKD